MMREFCGSTRFPQSFGRIAQTLRKLYVSTKCLYQEIRCKFDILRRVKNQNDGYFIIHENLTLPYPNYFTLFQLLQLKHYLLEMHSVALSSLN